MYPRGMTAGYVRRVRTVESLSKKDLWKLQKTHPHNCFERQKIMQRLQSVLYGEGT